MAGKSNSRNTTHQPIELLVSQEDAKVKILNRVEKGREISKRQISSSEELKSAQNEYYKWSEFNNDLLKSLFTNDSLSEEYSRTSPLISPGSRSILGEVDSRSMLGEEIKVFQKHIDEKVRRLESISERLELFPLSDSVTTPTTKKALANFQNESVFIVHGHDEGARETTARFLEKLGIQPIILHEQASGGRSILGKLEHHSNVDFAIILLTPDDVGAAKTSPDKLSSRARQNVIMELGYFLGKLGRERVCALHKGHVELPSDFLGVVYVPMDDNGGWRLQVAKELKEVGFSIDMNKAM